MDTVQAAANNRLNKALSLAQSKPLSIILHSIETKAEANGKLLDVCCAFSLRDAQVRRLNVLC